MFSVSAWDHYFFYSIQNIRIVITLRPLSKHSWFFPNCYDTSDAIDQYFTVDFRGTIYRLIVYCVDLRYERAIKHRYRTGIVWCIRFTGKNTVWVDQIVIDRSFPLNGRKWRELRKMWLFVYKCNDFQYSLWYSSLKKVLKLLYSKQSEIILSNLSECIFIVTIRTMYMVWTAYIIYPYSI